MQLNPVRDNDRSVQIDVILGDITAETADAVVTAANESLTGGGGVDGAIHRAAGPELAQVGGRLGPLDPGDAIATDAFAMAPRVRWIIHTVGPIWEGGNYGEADVLRSCYRRVLEVADQIGARTLCIPAIATGVYGYPINEAARIAVDTLLTTATQVETIRLVAFDDESEQVLDAALADHSP